MGAFSDSMTSLVSSLLTQFGEAVVISRNVMGDYDPSSGEAPIISTTTFSGFAVPEDYKASEIDGTLIIEGDSKLTLNQTSTAPQNGDAIVLGSETFRVISVSKYRAQGDTIAYELQVRK